MKKNQFEKGLGGPVMICKVCTFAIALKLTAVLSGVYHGSINPFTNPHTVSLVTPPIRHNTYTQDMYQSKCSFQREGVKKII
jgi:hypothetical protein